MTKSLIFIALFFCAIILACCSQNKAAYTTLKARELETNNIIYLKVKTGLYGKGDSLWATPINKEVWQIDTADNAMEVVILN